MVGLGQVVAGGFLVLVLAATPEGAQVQGIEPPAPGQAATTTSTIALGLRDALKISAQNAVAQTGRLDGFLKNDAIKILMPPSLRRVETGLRAIGYGDKVDEFVVAMNRAAERAAASAKPVFWDAIQRMTINDARGILTGGETAATEYFRSHTQADLAAAFRPIVQQATDEVGVTRQYKDLVQNLPFTNVQGLDIDQYVVGKTLDGLFYVLGQEEKKIRQDPAARVTAILREVFGGLGQRP